MKRLAAFILVLILVCSFISCNAENNNNEQQTSYTQRIGIDPIFSLRYYDIEEFIETWEQEYSKDDNFLLVEGKNYSDILLVPNVEGYQFDFADLSKQCEYYAFRLIADNGKRRIDVMVYRESESLRDTLIRYRRIEESSEFSGDFYDGDRELGAYYVHSHGLNIRVNPNSSYQFETAEELLGLLNLEVKYPINSSSTDTNTVNART